MAVGPGFFPQCHPTEEVIASGNEVTMNEDVTSVSTGGWESKKGQSESLLALQEAEVSGIWETFNSGLQKSFKKLYRVLRYLGSQWVLFVCFGILVLEMKPRATCTLSMCRAWPLGNSTCPLLCHLLATHSHLLFDPFELLPTQAPQSRYILGKRVFFS